MFATALIVFREVLEVGLIVGLVAAATRMIPGRRRYIAAGLAAGVLVSLALAAGAEAIGNAAAGMGPELVNATILLLAVAMLVWHQLWMQRHAAEMTRELRAVGGAVAAGQRPPLALALICGLATAREGAEVVLFLSGIAAGGAGTAALLSGAAFGIAAGGLVGAALYFGMLRIPTRTLFAVSSWLIALLAAGLAAQAAGYLIAIDLLPTFGAALWDSSPVLSEKSFLGQVLHVLIGYVAQPSGMQLLAYVLVFALMASPLVRPSRLAVPAVAAAVAVFAIAGLLSFAPPAQAAHKIYSPYVEQGELELELRGHGTRDRDPARNGERQTKLEAGYGVTEHWFTSVVAEFARGPGGPRTEHEATAWENLFTIGEPGQYWLDSGLYLEYEKAAEPENPNRMEAKLLLEKGSAALRHTANLVLERAVGADELDFGLYWRTKYHVSALLEPALEIYWEPGEANHYKPGPERYLSAGPVLGGKWGLTPRSKLRYEIGYLRGLSDATPAGTWKWMLEYERHL